jgi:hypothetical protein
VDSSTGSAALNLADLFCKGTHKLTLDVSDGEFTVSDSMYLSIGNSSPVAVPQIVSTARIGEDLVLAAQVADFDGDTLSYRWYEGGTTYFSGSVDTFVGEETVALPIYTLFNGLSLGSHQICLELTDSYGNSVTEIAPVEVVDTDAPVISPVANPSIIWPPNGELYPVAIAANASDNSGAPLTLSVVSIDCNGAPIVDDLGNVLPNNTEPVIDQTTGTVTFDLRAAKNPDGSERIYTITLSAEDIAANITQGSVQVVCPANRTKK